MRISDWSSDVCSSDLDPPLQAEPRDQQLRRGGRGEGEDERDLRGPVAHPVKKRAVGGRADERGAPRELGDLVETVARIKEHHHQKERRKGQPIAAGEDRKSTRLNYSHSCASRMPSS